MATKYALSAENRARTGSGKINQLRREGWVPAVVYGKEFGTSNIKINAKEFATLLAGSASEHILVNLSIEGKNVLALIQDVVHNAISGKIIHADFLAVSENKEIHSLVPVALVGEAAGVKQGGLLDLAMHEIEVRCLAKDLPDVIEIDVTDLAVGQVLHISEVKYPAGVRPVLAGENVVISIAETAALQSENS